jgi:FKBP-type peptidyl-prolyl cis-trans isomerase FklB
MKVKIIGVLACIVVSVTTVHGQKLKTEIDSVSYALGILFGKNIQSGGFQTVNADIFAQTVQKVIHNEDLDMTPDQANIIVNKQYQKIQQLKYEKNLKDGHAFLSSNKSAPGVVTLPSGLQYKIIKRGTGAKPTSTDKVTVHYHGALIDGSIFDSSVERKQPIELTVNQVIPGWIEALQLMPVGSKWILYIPSELAYGENPRPGGPIEPNSALVFEVELLSINN